MHTAKFKNSDTKALKLRSKFPGFFIGKNGGTAQLSITLRAAAFGDHILRVVLTCSQPEMGRIAAFSIVATMANKQTVWDRAVVEFIGKAVNQHRCSCGNRELTVTTTKQRASPVPTLIWAALFDVLPKPITNSAFVKIMTKHETNRFTLNVPMLSFTLSGNLSLLAATAHAKAARVWAGCIIFLARVVSVKKESCSSFVNRCFLAATALAVTGGYFVKLKYELRGICGMLHGVISSFLADDRAGSVDALPGISMGLIGVIIAQINVLCNHFPFVDEMTKQNDVQP